MYKTLRQVLVLLFDVPLEHFDERLQGLDLSDLKQLSETAFAMKTLFEFEAQLKDLETKKNKK